MLVLGIGSGERCGECSSGCIRGGICERSILRIVARFDPFLICLVGEYEGSSNGMTHQFINVPASILASLGRVG